MIQLKLLMFFSCAFLAPASNYLGLQYVQMGLPSASISILFSLPPLLSLLSFNIFLNLLQKLGVKNLILWLSLIGWSAFTLLCLSSSKKSDVVVYLYAIVAAISLPSIGQYVDTLTIEALGKNKDLYGQQRLWASLGWAFSSYVSGLLIDKLGKGETSGILVWIEAAFMSGFILVVLALPDTPAAQAKQSNIIAKPPSLKTILFLISVSLFSSVHATIGSYLFIFLQKELDLSISMLGLTTPFQILFELPLFFYSGLILNRFGSSNLILTSSLMLFLRSFAYWIFPSLGFPNAAILPIESLHGLILALSWSGSISYLSALQKGQETYYLLVYSSLTKFLGIPSPKFRRYLGKSYWRNNFGTIRLFWIMV